MKESIRGKIKNMTLEEKAALVNGETSFGTKALQNHGIEALQLLDGGTGMNFEQLFGDMMMKNAHDIASANGMSGELALKHVINDYYHVEKLTDEERVLRDWIADRLLEMTGDDMAPGCFPSGILLGATWCPETVYRVGQALGMEALHFGVNLLLGSPYVNLMRNPLNGRLFESYSEDPFLMSTLAPWIVKGVQEYGVAANVKHFAANNQETYRVGIDETISTRALEELYFPAFRACVEAGAATVMSAYNSINGVPCTENRWLLTEVLRNRWGFSGMVVSDWGAVYHPAEAITAGNDLAMPGPLPAEPIIEAVQNDSLKEEDLDTSVERILDLYAKWGPEAQEEKRVLLYGTKNGDAATKARQGKELAARTDKAAYEACLEGAVLLKNENGIFPLKGKVTLFGEGALQFYDCGTGSAGITTSRTTSLLKELQACMGDANVEYQTGEQTSDVFLVVARQLGMEGNDRKSMRLPEAEENGIRSAVDRAKLLGKKVGVILNVCGPVDCRSFIDDVDGLFCVFLPGMQGAAALARLLSGEENPSGRLPVTFPLRYEDTPTYLNFPGDGKHVIYGEDIFVGYRYYDTKDIDVLFPFGYGLSYTTFACSNVRVSAETFTDSVEITAEIKNTGGLAGKEVAALYVHDVCSSIRKPLLELKAFQKVCLKPDESCQVRFVLTREMLASYDMDLERFEAEEGCYALCVVTSAVDRRLLCRKLRETEDDMLRQQADAQDAVLSCVKWVYGDWKSAYSYSMDSSIKELYENEEIQPLLFGLFRALELDEGILYSSYEYTSYKTLRTILSEAGMETDRLLPELLGFEEKLSAVKRK